MSPTVMDGQRHTAENILDQIVSYNPTQVERELALLKREPDLLLLRQRRST